MAGTREAVGKGVRDVTPLLKTPSDSYCLASPRPVQPCVFPSLLEHASMFQGSGNFSSRWILFFFPPVLSEPVESSQRKLWISLSAPVGILLCYLEMRLIEIYVSLILNEMPCVTDYF